MKFPASNSTGISFEENAHAKKTDADFQLSTYELDGRIRLNPGDVAPPGTPSTGEGPCTDCQGKGQVTGQRCRTCDGSGIEVGIDTAPPGWQTTSPWTWWWHRWGWEVVAGEYVKLVYYKLAY